MKKLVVLLFATLSVMLLIGCNANGSRQLDGANAEKVSKAMVVLEFANLNKRVWLLDAKEKDIHFLTGHSEQRPSTSGTTSTVSLTGKATLQASGVKIESDASDVYLNGVLMKENLNAVIDKNGVVTLGAFIRNFD